MKKKADRQKKRLMNPYGDAPHKRLKSDKET